MSVFIKPVNGITDNGLNPSRGLIYIAMHNFGLISSFSNVVKNGACNGYGSVPTAGAADGNR